MRNLTRLATALCMGAFFTASVNAQIAAGTDLTDRLQNPGFESTLYTDLGLYPGDSELGYSAGTGGQRHQPEGWTVEAIMGNWNDVQAVNTGGTTYLNSAEGTRHFNTWAGQHYSSNIYQTVTDLPAGAYKLTAAMRMSNGDQLNLLNDQHIYGTNSDGLMFKSKVLSEAGAGATDENWETLETIIIMKEEGSLTIGAASTGDGTNAKGWFQVDDFKLIYMGGGDDYMVEYYQALINEANNSLSNYYDPNMLSAAGYQAITDAFAYMNEHEGSTDMDVLQNVVDSLESALTVVTANAKEVESLQDLITEIITKYEENPWDGYDDLRTVYQKAFRYYNNPDGKNEEGEPINTEDVKAMNTELNAALRTYRFKEPATADKPVDFTWAMQSPQFTKPGGDTSKSADATSAGWVTANVETGGDFRLNVVNNKNCWNNWSNSFTSMNVYQDMEGLPEGLYTFSCYQTNDGPEMTDQHAYATGIGGTAKSPAAEYTFAKDEDPDKGTFTPNSKWEGPLLTQKVLVGADGKLRIGFASTSNQNGSSGWFCFTDCVLTYYGMEDGAYKEAFENQIILAQDLTEAEMLKTNLVALEAAIETAKAVDTSDNEATIAGLEALNTSINETNEAVAALSTFKSGSYASAAAIVDDNEGVYSEEIKALMFKVVDAQDEILYADTTTTASFPAQTATLDSYISYVTSYQSCETALLASSTIEVVSLLTNVLADQTKAVADDAGKIEEAKTILAEYTSYANSAQEAVDFAEDRNNAEVEALIIDVLEAQTEIVTNDGTKIEAAKAVFKAVMSFSDMYILGMTNAMDEKYPSNMRQKLVETSEAQLAAVSEDNSKATEAEEEISKVLGEMRFFDLTPGADTDVSSIIINSDLEIGNDATGNSGNLPLGWTIDKADADKNTTTSQHWSGVDANRYLDSWNATPGKLKFTAKQTIKGIPNGQYRLVAAVRSSGNGAYLFASVADGIKWVEIINNGGEGGNIWQNAEEGSPEALANEGKGRGWNWMEVANINVNTNSITIGCSNVPEFTGGVAWTGNWFSADDFKLYWTSDEWSTDIENVGVDSTSELVVYAENGYITVVGVENFTILTLDGTEIPAKTQLAPGIYIVKTADKVAKVAVK